MARRRSSLLALVAVLAWLGPGSVRRSVAAPAAYPPQAQTSLARVRYIYHGLTVRPPKGANLKGKLHMSLFDRYALRTGHDQMASIQFQDKTVVHIDQRTDAVLRSPTQTDLQQGIVAEYLTPGTDHKIHTNAAVVTGIGTTFLVSATTSQSTFVVLHGVVQVSNPSGNVVVHSNQETTAVPGQAPQRPRAIDAKTVFGWTDTIPTPDLGENVALGANGAMIVGASSQRDDAGGQWHADRINDGLLANGWETAQGHVAGEWVKIGFYGSVIGTPNLFRVQSVIIDPAATHGDPPTADLKDFEIRVSSTGKNESDFTTVFHGHCQQQNTLQPFPLPVPILARYIEIRALDNYGDPNHLAVAEMEVVGTNVSFAYPQAIALDAHRNMYVTDTSNDRLLKLSPSGQVLATWGSKGNAPGQFTWPVDIAMSPQGHLWVVDGALNNRIQELSTSGRPLRQIGSWGTGPGQFREPSGIAFDRAGNIYVTEYFSNRIQKLSPSGRTLATWGTYGSKPGQFIAPTGIALDGHGNIYVADMDNNRIQKLSPQGKPLAAWGKGGKGRGQFNHPVRVAVDGAGFIYVTDQNNNRIVKLSPRGAVVATWGKFGLGEKSYYSPTGIVVGPQHTLYITEQGNNRIKIISSRDGHVINQLGVFGTVPQVLGRATGITVDSQGTMYVTDEGNGRLQIRAQDGSVIAAYGRRGVATGTQGLGQFNNPEGVAVDSLGYIYVADAANDRIQVLTPNGPVTAWGGWNVKSPDFDIPNAVAVDRQDNVYVADSGHNRIVKLTPQGTVIATYPTLAFPTGIALDRDGNMYVAAYNADRVQKLSPTGAPLLEAGVHGYRDLGQFSHPGGVAVDSHGYVYVADQDSDRIQKLSPDFKPITAFGAPGSGELRGPEAVAVDSHDNVYVADTFHLRIVKFSSDGTILGAWQ